MHRLVTRTSCIYSLIIIIMVAAVVLQYSQYGMNDSTSDEASDEDSQVETESRAKFWTESRTESSFTLERGMVRYHDVVSSGYNVTYDGRSFLINNKRTIILSGSVHYPRSTPGMWDHIFEEMIKDGLNAVEVYVFWNVHEFKRGQKYDFSGAANLPAKAGLFVNLRIGPYVCAEWNYGGLPVWLNSIPGMKLRSNTPVWKKEMERFVTDIAKIMEKCLARNGGPIILAQIENEFYWSHDKDYINWCGELVDKLDLGIPWVMCSGLSASNTINTCNGNDCQEYASKHIKKYPGQPLAWTENEGWFQQWSKPPFSTSNRSPENVSYAILSWFAIGGAHHNYYMWYGGNHMGRWAAAAITNKYADGVNMHSDLLPNEPKRTHLTRLHKLIAENNAILLESKIQINNPVHLLYYNKETKKFEKGTQQLAFVYDNDAGRIVFMQNSAPVDLVVKYDNMKFTMQQMSIIVLDKSNTILYDSSKVNSTGLRTNRVYTTNKTKMNPFVAWSESIEDITKGALIAQHPLEQLGVTQDMTEYLFYQVELAGPLICISKCELVVQTRTANSLLLFVDKSFVATLYNNVRPAGHYTMTFKYNIDNIKKEVNFTILSVSLGLNNGRILPGFVESKGIVGKVTFNGADITNRKWLHRPKLTGEILQVYTDDGSKQVKWDSDWIKYAGITLTWFKTTFTVEQYSLDYSLLLHLVGFGRGHFYVNGIDLGRYWLITMNGKPVQEYYFIPPDVVKYDGPNLLVIGEELGAPDPSKATLVLSTMKVSSYQ